MKGTMKRAKTASRKASPAVNVDHPKFAPVMAAFAGNEGVDQGRMFGSVSLKVGGKVFAMLVKGSLVVKLPKARVDALVASGSGGYFDPGHGKLMKEWAAVSDASRSWVQLAKEAYAFVRGDGQ